MPHEGVPDEVQGSSSNGEPPCRFVVYTMPSKVKRKANKKQRRSFLDRIDVFAAALFWFVKTILMLIDWFTR